MKYTLTFIIGLLVGIGVHWFLTQPKNRTARENVRTSANDVGQSLKETFDTEKIKEELSNTGQVIREKARQAGNAIADATANARITAAVKTKLVGDSGLSAFKIDVDTTDGVVTLSGTVPTYEAIAKAMSLAWDTDGVHKVISTLQVKSSRAAVTDVTTNRGLDFASMPAAELRTATAAGLTNCKFPEFFVNSLVVQRLHN